MERMETLSPLEVESQDISPCYCFFMLFFTGLGPGPGEVEYISPLDDRGVMLHCKETSTQGCKGCGGHLQTIYNRGKVLWCSGLGYHYIGCSHSVSVSVLDSVLIPLLIQYSTGCTFWESVGDSSHTWSPSTSWGPGVKFLASCFSLAQSHLLKAFQE